MAPTVLLEIRDFVQMFFRFGATVFFRAFSARSLCAFFMFSVWRSVSSWPGQLNGPSGAGVSPFGRDERAGSFRAGVVCGGTGCARVIV